MERRARATVVVLIGTTRGLELNQLEVLPYLGCDAVLTAGVINVFLCGSVAATWALGAEHGERGRGRGEATVAG